MVIGKRVGADDETGASRRAASVLGVAKMGAWRISPAVAGVFDGMAVVQPAPSNSRTTRILTTVFRIFASPIGAGR